MSIDLPFWYNVSDQTHKNRKEPMLVNIILYFLQLIQYLFQQNCWLLSFICKYIPLKQCYITCLEVAELYEIDSIAFCSISAGENLFPKEAAARIAIDTVMEYIQNHDRPKQIIFTVADDEDLEIYTHLLSLVC